VTDILLGLNLFLLLGVLAFLIVLAKRRAGGDAQAENDLRAQVAARAAQVAELRSQVAAGEKQAADLRLGLQAEHGARVSAETRLQAERQSFQEQRALLDEAQTKLKDAFAALSAEALKDSRTQFLSQADEKLRPIQSLLKDYEQKLDAIEKARNTAYGGLEQHLNELLQSGQKWEKEAHQLSTALKSPTGSVEWGQLALRNVVELAGMSKHCDFDEQVAVVTEEGLKKPDMKVLLPNHRTIVVDAKAPLNAYREAVNAPDDKARREALDRHAQAVRGHMRALSQKSYWAQFKPTPEFVVLFLPGESFFAGAVEQDHALIEDSMKSGVVLASPTTLLALLKAVAYGWRQEALAENAQRIADTGRELYERVRVFADFFRKIGNGLKAATDAYSAAVGSYQTRLEPGARRLAELGASSGKELPDVPPVDGPTRALPAPDGESQAQGG
jgi:DNA recombination protein RmuC